MALSLIDYSTLPQGPRVAGPPAVTVRDNGQIAMSSTAAKALEGCNFVMIGADLDAAKAGKAVAVQLAGFDAEPKGKEGKGRNISRGKAGKNCTVSMASALKGILGYDFQKAGNQLYPAQINEAKHLVLFTLPAELPKAKAKVTRTKKSATVAAAPVAEPATAPESEDELGF
jgi:hypothetical protein